MNKTARSKLPSGDPSAQSSKFAGTASPGLSAPLSVMSSRLTGMIAHDLRTPITVIRGYLKMLINGRIGPVTEEQRTCIEGALNSVDALTHLAGIVGGTSGLFQQLQPEVLNVQVLWRNVSPSIETLALEKAIRLRERLAENLRLICGDRRIISDVIEKMIVNAIALADRGTEILVDLAGTAAGNIVLQIVFNCGSQEPPVEDVVSEMHAKVFLHGGQLKYNAKSEAGSSFTLSLPGHDS